MSILSVTVHTDVRHSRKRLSHYGLQMLTVRRAVPRDDDFLLRTLALAADWRPDARPRSVAEVLASPDLAHYAPDWTADRDRGLVAEIQPGQAVGAAWWRFLPVDHPGYGFVSADVPELSVGVVQAHRGRGIGTLLLRELVALAAEEGLPALSLSVEPDNVAAHLYRRLGFVPVGTNSGADTMLLPLT